MHIYLRIVKVRDSCRVLYRVAKVPWTSSGRGFISLAFVCAFTLKTLPIHVRSVLHLFCVQLICLFWFLLQISHHLQRWVMSSLFPYCT